MWKILLKLLAVLLTTTCRYPAPGEGNEHPLRVLLVPVLLLLLLLLLLHHYYDDDDY